MKQDGRGDGPIIPFSFTAWVQTVARMLTTPAMYIQALVSTHNLQLSFYLRWRPSEPKYFKYGYLPLQSFINILITAAPFEMRLWKNAISSILHTFTDAAFFFEFCQKTSRNKKPKPNLEPFYHTHENKLLTTCICA